MTIEQYPSSNNIATTTVWKYTATGSELTLSGYDNYSQSLQFTAGSEQVYLNGVLLVRNLDYTPAANGLSITFPTNLAYNDFVQIYCYSNYSVSTVSASSITGTIQNSQLTNPSITIGNQSISLGGTLTTATGLSISGSVNTLTNIPNSALSNSSIIVNGNPISLGGSVNIITPSTYLANKGGLIVGTGGGAATQLTPSADGYYLLTDSSQISGLRWATPNTYVNRNFIINGAMEYYQRPSITSGGYGMDRWYVSNFGGGWNGLTISQGTSLPPTGFRYYQRAQFNSTTYTNCFISQSLETSDVIQLAGQTVTLSFYYRTPVTGTPWGWSLNYSTATDGNLSYGNTRTSFAFGALNSVSGNTWQYYSTTTTIPSTATSLSLEFYETNNTTNGAQFDFTGVKLELGNYATPFSRSGLSIPGELANCQRFCCSGFYGTQGFAYSATSGVMFFKYPVTMRKNATPYYMSGSSIYIDYIGGSQGGVTLSPSGANGSLNGYSATLNGMSGRTTWQGIIHSPTGSDLYFDAEI